MEAVLFISLVVIIFYQRYKLREAAQYAKFLEDVDRQQRAALISAKLQLNDSNVLFERFWDLPGISRTVDDLITQRDARNKTLAGNKKVIEQINNLNK